MTHPTKDDLCRSIVTALKWVAVNHFQIICLILAAYFFWAFDSIVGFPPHQPLDASASSYLTLAFLFFILPSAKRLKLGKFLEYEAKVKEIKKEVEEFKTETRQLITVYSGLVSNISNSVRQNVTVNLPSPYEAQKARQQLASTLQDEVSANSLQSKIQIFLAEEGYDFNYALAKLRIELEKQLRRILNKTIDSNKNPDGNQKFLSARSLFSKFIEIYSQYDGMTSSFDYVLKVCNAAIHGQDVSDGYATEALQMGLQILQELKKINQGN